MKKIMFVVICMLLFSVLALSGCIKEDIHKASYFDNKNIKVLHHRDDGDGEYDYLLITIYSTGNYTVYISFVTGDNEIKARSFYFQVQNVPYQYRFEYYTIKDYDLLVTGKS